LSKETKDMGNELYNKKMKRRELVGSTIGAVIEEILLCYYFKKRIPNRECALKNISKTK
jgi:hypothetical protein